MVSRVQKTVPDSQPDASPSVEDREAAFLKTAFECPHCHAYAHQEWTTFDLNFPGGNFTYPPDTFRISMCSHCGNPAIWLNPELIYPRRRIGVRPHEDMPEKVRAIYDEAREVAAVSRKSAAALLRLALQLLIEDLEPGGENVNKKIGALVKRGLHPGAQQAMDALRVIGNNAVHPGQIDFGASDDLVPALFGILNVIVEQVITRPQQIEELYASLPETSRSAIAKRDDTESS